MKDRRRIAPVKKRRAPLGDLLTLGFLAAVALMWAFSDKIGGNAVSLTVLTLLALLLMVNMFAARKARRKAEQSLRDVEEIRAHIGDTDDTDERDKYYF
jgi:L-asparagine transporter-like permease